ncbi:citrate lyase beta subunit [Herbihabitans rhizosphaerae]|uniref:Citrate lyase beta subunit n=1 Tax=Herbihabitans rhizosphaerae TaxID=1872711 RepID=A0A4Q7KKG8_9PSEU|nr:aldolase/citrate lyase family protein [Herbihabitans rhizosphaerae]RZS36370.1 citrate lyase beta subunit [Herbihabitans rhizosphaerae]
MDDLLAELDSRLAAVDAALLRRYPGDAGTRQPVHTVYVPADRFHSDLCREWGAAAEATLTEHAPDATAFAAATGVGERQVYQRVVAKLAREPIEDLRIDFEDGYGVHPDEEEDAAVRAAAVALAGADVRPPFVGIRFKSLEAATRRRGVRTLELFLRTLTDAGPLPRGFVVTLPKVTAVEQVAAMALVCERLEAGIGLRPGELLFEIQIETPQSILGPDGTAAVARMIDAAAGRCTGLHYGTYDYSAALGISAAYQSMEHPAADHAKAVMQLAAAGTGVRLSDGSTNILPVGDRKAVHAAWHLHARLVRRSLERGFYQGWDLHPTQLPTRYAATYAFFREGLPSAAARLRAYVARTASGVLDEPATAQALASFVTRGLNCGAVEDAEVHQLTGLDRPALDALARRS